MSDKSTLMNHVTDDASTLGGKLSDTAMQVKDKLTDFGRAAGEKMDENRDAAASGLQRAADALHERAGNEPGAGMVSGITNGVANNLSSTADYVRGHDMKKMMADVETIVKSNPGPALLAAAVIGFLAARAFSRNGE